MIPKIIHYCWFGNSTIPKKDYDCIKSWEKLMPDYEIKRWDESNFDVTSYQYASSAYEAKKWAYVSDCARYHILAKEGGIFLDTDVKVIKRFDDLLGNECFFGVEKPNYSVAPGLIIGAELNHYIINELSELYKNSEFLNPDLVKNAPTSPDYATEALKRNGFVQENKLQKLFKIIIYPSDYFAPMNHVTGITTITPNTYSIHLYNTSWESVSNRKWHDRRYKLNRIFGIRLGFKLYQIWSLPERILDRLKSSGWKKTLKYVFSKFYTRKNK